jgi:hypothetical protein
MQWTFALLSRRLLIVHDPDNSMRGSKDFAGTHTEGRGFPLYRVDDREDLLRLALVYLHCELQTTSTDSRQLVS